MELKVDLNKFQHERENIIQRLSKSHQEFIFTFYDFFKLGIPNPHTDLETKLCCFVNNKCTNVKTLSKSNNEMIYSTNTETFNVLISGIPMSILIFPIYALGMSLTMESNNIFKQQYIGNYISSDRFLHEYLASAFLDYVYRYSGGSSHYFNNYTLYYTASLCHDQFKDPIPDGFWVKFFNEQVKRACYLMDTPEGDLLNPPSWLTDFNKDFILIVIKQIFSSLWYFKNRLNFNHNRLLISNITLHLLPGKIQYNNWVDSYPFQCRIKDYEFSLFQCYFGESLMTFHPMYANFKTFVNYENSKDYYNLKSLEYIRLIDMCYSGLLLPQSFDFYYFLISFVSQDMIKRIFFKDSDLIELWKLLWIQDDHLDAMNEILKFNNSNSPKDVFDFLSKRNLLHDVKGVIDYMFEFPRTSSE
jgi:hypothetical protein